MLGEDLSLVLARNTLRASLIPREDPPRPMTNLGQSRDRPLIPRARDPAGRARRHRPSG
ncbi:hypothetical protein BX257_3802 [Streptomyces sp. 3212.3]|nr:hypothetical protein BX257_3802 [Streptomyces sp. 3212.3]